MLHEVHRRDQELIKERLMIISRTTDHVDRKLTEAIHIAIESPPLNTDSRWKLLPTVRGRPQSKAAIIYVIL